MRMNVLSGQSSGERPHPSPLPEGEGAEGSRTARAVWLPSPALAGEGLGVGASALPPLQQPAHVGRDEEGVDQRDGDANGADGDAQ